MKLFQILAVLLFLLPFVSGFSAINVYVEPDGTAQFLGTINSNSIELPSGIEIRGNQIQGVTSELTSKQGSVWTFDFSAPSTEFTLFLPEGAVILDALNATSIGLNNNLIVLTALDHVQVSYRLGSVRENKQLKGLSLIGIALLLLIATYWATRYYKQREQKLSKNKEVTKTVRRTLNLKNILNERENIILDTLKNTGPIRMSYLRKRCDIPKASFSRHIRELSRKKLVVLTGEGKNKLVTLSDGSDLFQ